MCKSKVCAITVILIIQVNVSVAIKFSTQTIYITNAKGTIVGQIPIQGIIDKKLPAKVQTVEKAVLFAPPSGSGCNLEHLADPKVKMKNEGWKDSVEILEFILIVNTLDCDLPTIIKNAFTAGYTAVILHNIVTNDNPSSVVIEASDVRSHSRAIKIFFVGQKYGRLLIDLFASPKGYYLQVHAFPDDFYLTRTEEKPEESLPRRKVQKTKEEYVSKPPRSIPHDLWSWKFRTRTELEQLLEIYCYFPPVISFFGGIILWFLQNAIIWIAVFGGSFVVVVILLWILSVFLKLCAKITPQVQVAPEESADQQGQNIEELIQERITERDTLMAEMMSLLEILQEEQRAVPPLTEDVINSLIQCELDYEESSRLGLCVICQQALNPSEMVTRLDPSCVHVFHSECIQRWLTMSGNCPTCRTSVTGNVNFEID